MSTSRSGASPDALPGGTPSPSSTATPTGSVLYGRVKAQDVRLSIPPTDHPKGANRIIREAFGGEVPADRNPVNTIGQMAWM